MKSAGRGEGGLLWSLRPTFRVPVAYALPHLLQRGPWVPQLRPVTHTMKAEDSISSPVGSFQGCAAFQKAGNAKTPPGVWPTS